MAKARMMGGVLVGFVLLAASSRMMAMEIPSMLIDAIAVVETGGVANAVGDGNTSFGAWQIQRPTVADVNRAYGESFRVDDAFDPVKARRICALYLRLYGGKLERRLGRAPTVTELARMWNGGPRGIKKERTRDYGTRVAAIYESIVGRQGGG